MALESGNYVNDLVITNPPLSDTTSQGANHLQLIKKVLKQSFTAITGAMTVSHTYLNQMNIPNMIICWPTNTPPTGWKLCSSGAGNTSTGQAIPNLNTSNRVGTTYWIIKD